jgi:hypothetical protein
MGNAGRRFSISGGLGLALTLMGTGLQLWVPDMIVPPVWGVVLLVAGISILLVTLVAALREFGPWKRRGPLAPQILSEAQAVSAKASADLEIVRGRLVYVEGLLAAPSVPALQKWRKKLDFQRLRLDSLRNADTRALTPTQATRLEIALRKSDELEMTINSLVKGQGYKNLAHAAGLYAHRARELHAALSEVVAALGAEPHSSNTTHGTGSHIFAGPVHNPTFHAHAAHAKFSAICELTTLPSYMGGQSVIDLDSVATLRLSPPYSIDSATLALDPVPMRQPDAILPGAEFRDIQVTAGRSKRFSFDTGQNKRHTMEAGGKVFIVTLRETEALSVEGVANPLKFVFAVKEA